MPGAPLFKAKQAPGVRGRRCSDCLNRAALDLSHAARNVYGVDGLAVRPPAAATTTATAAAATAAATATAATATAAATAALGAVLMLLRILNDFVVVRRQVRQGGGKGDCRGPSAYSKLGWSLVAPGA